MSRKLARILVIDNIDPIPNADKIEVATLLGWQVVVQKDQFKVGDKVMYFEIDSILPADASWSAFMECRKYKVKTIKLRKQISQGLVIPLKELGISPDTVEVDDDFTELLGVTKYEKPVKEGTNPESKREKIPHSWMLRFPITRRLHSALYPRREGDGWPSFIPKTDETRVQNLRNVPKIVSERHIYATEKLDGQSFTAFFKLDEKVGLFSRGLFGVCSRNVGYKDVKDDNNWGEAAIGLYLEDTLDRYCRATGRSIAIQGELIGRGIQGNKYKLKGRRLYIFSVYSIDEQRYLSYSEKVVVIKTLGLDRVPSVRVLMDKRWEAKGYLSFAEGKSVINPEVEREGVVIRDIFDDSFSFKAVSNKWLLKYDNGN